MLTPPQWTVLIPVKQTAVAKSRLTGFALPVRQHLALAFASDVVVAALDCAAVGDVVVVTSDEHAGARLSALGARVVRDGPEAGLNPALEWAEAAVRSGGRAPLVVISADLPAARACDLQAALDAAPSARWFVPDLAGDGTTMLGAPAELDLAPAFGSASRAAHLASGAVELGPAGRLVRLRSDVDTAADLRAAVDLGVGVATAGVLTEAGWSMPRSDRRAG